LGVLVVGKGRAGQGRLDEATERQTYASVDTQQRVQLEGLTVRGNGAVATTIGELLAAAGIDGLQVEVAPGRWRPIAAMTYGDLLGARRETTTTF
jgi:hypothetical protein